MKRIENFCIPYPFFLTIIVSEDTNETKVICFAFALRYIAPVGRSDIIFASKLQRTKCISRPKDISRIHAYHSPKANIAVAPALSQMRQ